MEEEHALGRRPATTIFGFPAEDFQGDSQVEPSPLVFGLRHDVRLKGREVVGQLGHGGRKNTAMAQLVQEEIDRVGQVRGGEDLVAD